MPVIKGMLPPVLALVEAEDWGDVIVAPVEDSDEVCVAVDAAPEVVETPWAVEVAEATDAVETVEAEAAVPLAPWVIDPAATVTGTSMNCISDAPRVNDETPGLSAPVPVTASEQTAVVVPATEHPYETRLCFTLAKKTAGEENLKRVLHIRCGQAERVRCGFRALHRGECRHASTVVRA